MTFNSTNSSADPESSFFPGFLIHIFYLRSPKIKCAMSLRQQVMEQMKVAMKAKDKTALEALRAIKSALLLAQTEAGGKDGLSKEAEVKLIQKQVKQRRDSAAIFKEQGRDDLAEPELAQAAVIEQFLPEQLSEEEIEKVVDRLQV
jgi:uncharacterized protein YqeY